MKSRTILIACGTPAACCWLPQALALPTVFRDVFVEQKTLVVRCVVLLNSHMMMETTQRHF